MEAFRKILQALPPDTGMAFVFVQHLDPLHKSLLVNIFAKATRMPVIEAVEGVGVEPNHVYVIPPNQTLTISRGRLSMTPRTQRAGEYLPIDAFLRSLAQEEKENAVAVILSGTSSDGTLGLIEVKHGGGITFAQDETAKYDSMPGGAIKSGAVDFILPAEAIARELTRIARHREEMERRSDSEPAAPAPADIRPFFRDPELFEELRKTVIPSLLRDRPPDEPLRIWVPGCGTGEEAYSLAICFLEALNGALADMKIFASDVNDRLVASARSGMFPASLPDEIGVERVQRFFTYSAGRYQACKAVREICVFAQHDVTKDPPFSSLDLISSRNLPESVVKQVTPIFHYALKGSGYLLAGASEPSARFRDLFKAVDRRGRIFLKNPVAARLPFDFQNRGAAPATDLIANTADVEREADRLAFRHYGHAGVLVTAEGEIIQFKGDTGPFLPFAGGGSGLELGNVARQELRAPLAMALQRAAKTGKAQRSKNIEIQLERDEARHVSFEILPLESLGRQRYFLVLFEMFGARAPARKGAAGASREADRREIAHLQQLLAASTENLHSTIDELRASHEELLSRNEELKSIGDQLEIRGQQFENANEELTAINEQLQMRNSQLAHALADLNNLLEAVRVPIVLLGPGKRIRMFTPAARSVLNISSADIGKLLTGVQTNLDLDSVAATVDEAIRTKAAREMEIADRNGNWYLMRTHPYRTAEGETAGAVLVLFDIGNRKRMEQERERLMESIESGRAKLQSIIEQMPSGVVVAEAPTGKIVFENRRVELILGHSFLAAGQIDEQSRYVGFHAGGRPYSPEEWPLARSLHTGEVVANEEIEYIRGDGCRFTMRAGSAPIRDRENRIVAAVFVFDDITEQKTFQQRLVHAQRLETIGRLAGGVAHDFNNLLTVIIGSTESVREHARLSRHFRSELDSVLRAASRASSLTSQLLAFSRRQMIQPRAIDLHSAAAAMYSLLRRLVGERIELRMNRCEQPCVVVADPGQLELMVMNLVTNARDAIEGDGTITVETAAVKLDDDPEIGSGEFVRLSVSDTGAGMGEETKRHVFEPFFTTKGLGRGTGLGLSSVYGAVKQNGGEMRLESELGKGARFEIYLPRVHAEPEPPRIEVAPEVAQGSETILVVEDEAHVRALARRYLERLGYEVIEAVNGVEALRAYKDYPGLISLLLADIVMPMMDGRELARRLLEDQPGLKVLFTSGYPLDTIGGSDLGAEPHFLQKPFDGQALGSKVREILDEP